MLKVADFFLQRSFVVNLLAVAVVICGVLALTSLNRDLIPPFQWQMIRVSVSLPGATPEEMERYVTFPIEEVLEGMPGLERMQSVSSSGQSRIDLYYEASFSRMAEALELVQARMNTVRHRLPNSIRNIVAERAQVNDVFLFFLAIENFDEQNIEHRLFYDRLERRLNDITGVVRLDTSMRKRDIYIQFDPDQLHKHEISVSQVRQVISTAVGFSPVGQTRVGTDFYAVEIAKISDSIEELRQLPIRSNRLGNTIRLEQVATVEYRLEDRDRHFFVNGRQAVHILVKKDISSDTIDLKPKVLGVIEEFNSQAPDGLNVVNLIDGPRFLEQQIDVLSRNGWLGFALVLLILVAFFNWKTAAMTGIGLPVVYAGTFITMYLLGVNIDLLSIVGVILVVGILVDDAIIMTERYVNHLSDGLKPQEAARTAVADLLLPVTGTVLTTVIAFAPLIFIKSEVANMLFAIPVVVIGAMILSWLESFFILPNHLAHFVKTPPKEKKWNIFSRLQKAYEFLLAWAIKGRYVLSLVVLAILVVSVSVGFKSLRHEFNLNISPETLTIYAILKESPSMEYTKEKIAPIENFLRSLPRESVQNVAVHVGWMWMHGRQFEGVRYARVDAYLNNNVKHPSRLKSEMKALLESQVSEFKDEEFEKISVEFQREGGDEDRKNMVSIRVRGSEEVDFHQIEQEMVTQAKALQEIDSYVDDPDRYQVAWSFVPDIEALRRYQLDNYELSRQIRGLFMPHEITETRIQGENVFIYTESQRKQNLELDQLNKYEVFSAMGTAVPLGYLGEWVERKSLRSIRHHDGRRNLRLDFRVSEDFNTTVARQGLQSVVGEIQNKYPTYEISVIDANEQEAKARIWAIKVALACVMGVLLVLALILGSLTQPLLVGLPIPFSIVGIVFALYLHDLPLGLMALVGVIGTVGVSVNASIVMMDQINKLVKKQGGFSRDLLIQGASNRLRPIVLTTLTTLGGVFPMAYALGGESGFTQPLAFAMGWGLSSSTLLTLFVLPALVQVREDILFLSHRLIGKIFRRGKTKSHLSEYIESVYPMPDFIKDNKTCELQLPKITPSVGSSDKENSPNL